MRRHRRSEWFRRGGDSAGGGSFCSASGWGGVWPADWKGVSVGAGVAAGAARAAGLPITLAGGGLLLGGGEVGAAPAPPLFGAATGGASIPVASWARFGLGCVFEAIESNTGIGFNGTPALCIATPPPPTTATAATTAAALCMAETTWSLPTVLRLERGALRLRRERGARGG